MTPDRSDALIALQQQVPPRVFAFAQALVTDPDPSIPRAAEAAGAPGQGAELMRDPRTAKVLSAFRAESAELFKSARVQLVTMLVTLCGYDPADAFDEFGEPMSIRDIPPYCRIAIKAWKKRADGGVEITFVDRLAAMRLAMEHFGDVDSRTFAPQGTAQVVFRGRGE